MFGFVGVLVALPVSAVMLCHQRDAMEDATLEGFRRLLLEAAREYLGLLKDDWDTCRSINANMRADKSAIEGYGS